MSELNLITESLIYKGYIAQLYATFKVNLKEDFSNNIYTLTVFIHHKKDTVPPINITYMELTYTREELQNHIKSNTLVASLISSYLKAVLESRSYLNVSLH